MKNILSLLCLMMLTMTSAWADDVKVTWAMGESTTGVADPATAATDIKYTVGAGLTENGTSSFDGMTYSKFDQNTGSEKGNNGKHDQNVELGKYVDFTFTPVGGSFTPTKVSFNIVKNGTGDPSCDVDFIDGEGTTITVASNKEIIRNNADAGTSTAHSYSISGATSSDGAVTLRIIIGKLASGKSVGIANVVIEGTLASSDAPVLTATNELSLKVTPLSPGMTATGTIALTGKNLTDGIYDTPVPADDAITITPATFTVAGGQVSQEFTVTYQPTSSVSDGFTKVFFTVGDLTAGVDISYQARLEAYEQTVVSAAAAWDWETLTETVELTDESVPSRRDDFVFKELEDQINFGSFDAQSIIISKTQYPVRGKRFQNGTIKFKTVVPGTITVDFSDTGSSGDGVMRYLYVNGTQTEYYTQRDGSSDRKVSGEIVVPAGEVSICGWDPTAEIKDDEGNVIGTGNNVAIVVYKVTFEPINPLQEAKDLLTKAIALAEMVDAEGLAGQIAAGKTALAGEDITAIQTALNSIIAAAAPKAQALLAEVKEFADKYGYSEVAEKVAAVSAAIPGAESGNIAPLMDAIDALTAVALPAAQDAIGKIDGYAQALNDADLNTAIENAKKALETKSIKNIIAAVKAAEEPFKNAAQAFVARVQAENIKDANVQSALAAVVAAMRAENPSIVAIGDAVKKLIDAYNAYQSVDVTHTWDFTQWSDNTISNLKLEAAKVTVEDDPDNDGYTKCTDNGAFWSDHEKATKCNTYEASKDNCFWYVGGEAVPTANRTAIEELAGLEFNTSYGTTRSLAIAVNYPKTSLGTYKGGAYLWLGSSKKDCFTIKNVKVGSELTMGVESHKPSEGRGVQLKINGENFGDAFTPTAFAENTWTITSTTSATVVDVVVSNTNGCHIYYIDAEIENTSTGINTIATSADSRLNDAVIYNLNGQRVQNAQKGLYIVNGRKVVVK